MSFVPFCLYNLKSPAVSLMRSAHNSDSARPARASVAAL